ANVNLEASLNDLASRRRRAVRCLDEYVVRRDIVEYAVFLDQCLKNLSHGDPVTGGARCADVPLLAWQVACHFVGTVVRSATRVPKEIDEKHELSRPCRDFGARMRAALNSKIVYRDRYNL